MKVSKITVGRLFNKGNYEHVRYELTVDVKEGESAAAAITGMERILEAMKPLDKCCIKTAQELERGQREIDKMLATTASQWEREYGHCTGTPSEVIERYLKSLREETDKRDKALERARMARKAFDDLGGTETWKDAKLDWEDDYGDDL